MIERIVETQEDDHGNSWPHYVLDCERQFILEYANQHYLQTKRGQEEIDQFSHNIIYILNHFLEYGFEQKRRGSDTTISNNSSMQNASEEHQREGSAEPGSRMTHYWDLITKYFQKEYQSVAYVNDEYSQDQEEQASNEEKALTWLIITLNEDQQLFYCFHSIFQSGTFLSYYKENESYLFKDRDKLLEISRKIYDNKIYINSEINTKYQAYLQRCLQQRIQQNQNKIVNQPEQAPDTAIQQSTLVE